MRSASHNLPKNLTKFLNKHNFKLEKNTGYVFIGCCQVSCALFSTVWAWWSDLHST